MIVSAEEGAVLLPGAESDGFKVPIAIRGGKPVRPSDARPSTPYGCPTCGQTVYLRSGRNRRRHFYHAVPGGCTGEGWQHKVAKARVAEVVNQARGVPLTWTCGKCHAPTRSFLWLSDVLETKWGKVALMEVTVYPYRADVGIVVDNYGPTIAAVEVVYTHAMEPEKAAAWHRQQFLHAEIEAQDVIDHWDGPWTVLRGYGGFGDPHQRYCNACLGIVAVLPLDGLQACIRFGSVTDVTLRVCDDCAFNRSRSIHKKGPRDVGHIDCSATGALVRLPKYRTGARQFLRKGDEAREKAGTTTRVPENHPRGNP